RNAIEFTEQGVSCGSTSMTMSPWFVVTVIFDSFMLTFLGGMPTNFIGTSEVSFLYSQVTGPVMVGVGRARGESSASSSGEGDSETSAASGVADDSLLTRVVTAKMPPATTATARPAPMKVLRLALDDCSAARCCCRSLC